MRGGVTRERPCCMNILEEWCFLCVSDIMIIIGSMKKSWCIAWLKLRI
jgi:hypothetical protein